MQAIYPPISSTTHEGLEIFIFQYINKLHIFNLHHRINQTQQQIHHGQAGRRDKVRQEEDEKYYGDEEP